MTTDGYMDYAPFASSKFNPTFYANAILAGERYDPEETPEDPEGDSSNGVAKNKDDAASKNVGFGGAGNGSGTASLSVKGDVSVALAKLNYGIEDVDRQMKHEIEENHPLLLKHLASSSTLSSNVTTIQSTLTTLSASLSRLHTKIHLPHSELKAQVERLEKVRCANEVLKRVSRFLVLARRLEGQMGFVTNKIEGGKTGGGDGKEDGSGEGEREREMAKAALTIAELDILLQEPESPKPAVTSETDAAPVDPVEEAIIPLDPDQIALTSLDVVKAQVLAVRRARDVVIEEMEGMVINGLANLNQPLLSTSLQTAHNLRLLPQLVSNLLADLNDAVETRIGKVFDMESIGKEVAQKEQPSAASAATSLLYRSTRLKPSSTPTNQNISIFHDVLWRRLDVLLEDIAQCCIKVYTLEKVLRMKKVVNPNTGFGLSAGGTGLGEASASVLDEVKEGSFLNECLETMEEKPTFTFWTTLATSLDTQTRAICEANNFLQQALSSNYPRFLRLFHTFFAKIAVHTETVYTQEHQSPETVLCLRAISKFETLYLSRSSARMTDSINAAFSGGYKQPPGSKEGNSVSRIMLNEMDSARFDPLLGRNMARLIGKAVDAITGKVDSLLVKDFSATSLIGPLASSAQVNNSALVSFVYHIVYSLRNPFTEFPSKIIASLQTPLQAAEKCYGAVTAALDTAIKRELSTIFARVHRVDFAKSVDPMSSMGMGGGTGGSPYIKDLADRLNFLRTEILGRFDMGAMRDEWLLSLTRHAIRAFLLNASIARPLGESGKLKLTGDMTELEFALNTFLATGHTSRQNATRLDAAGRDYKSLRAFRTCLFLDHTSLAHPAETQGIAPLVLLHHIIVLSPLQLPHQIHEWSEQEYILWIDKHSEEEGWRLLEKAVDGQRDGKGAEEWRGLIREVLQNARSGKMKTD